MWRRHGALLLVATLVMGVSLFYLFNGHTSATTGINQELSFEGKIVTAAGVNIPDGTYNMEFQIYTGCTNNTGSGCTSVWTEDELVSASQGVSFTSGTFQLNLGAVNPFGTSVPWNTYPLYLSLQIGNTSSCTPAGNFTANCGGDGVMSPYILLTSTPYALNSNELGGLTSSSYAQLSANQTFTGNNTFQTTTNSTQAFQVNNSSSGAELQIDTTDNAIGLGTAPVLQYGVDDGFSAPNYTNGSGLAVTTSLTSTSNSQDAIYANPTIAPASASTSHFNVIVANGYSASNNVASATIAGVTSGVYYAGTNSLYAATGVYVENTNSSTGTIANNYGLYVDNPINSGGGSITTNYGLYVARQTTGATNYEIYLAGPSTTPLYSETNTGSATFSTSTNSTSGFQIQNSGGTDVFDTDTTNGRVSIDSTITALGAPGALTLSNTATTGGSLAGNTNYYYEVTAVDAAGGETTASPENHILTATGTSTNEITVSWAPVAGAAGYRVYRGTSSNGETGYYSVVGTNSSGTAVSFLDTGATQGVTTGSPPTTNSAYSTAGTSNNSLQLSIGGNGNDTGQVYVGGTLPSQAAGTASTPYAPLQTVVSGSYEYVANNSGFGFSVFKIGTASAPTLVASVGTYVVLNSIFIQGNYLYTISNSGNLFAIFNVLNPYAPTLVGSSTTSFGGSLGSDPIDVYVSGRYAYVDDYLANSLQIFDVSNPTSPVSVGVDGTTGGLPSGVFVQNQVAYVIADYSTYLYDINVANPASPATLGTLALAYTPISIVVQGNYAYIIESSGTNYVMQIVDISNPSSPVVVGKQTLSGAGPASIYVAGRYAYIAAKGSNEVEVVDVSNPANPADVGTISTQAGPVSAVVQGRYLYVANGTADSIQTFDIGGTYTQSLQAGSTETGNLEVDTNANISGDASIGGGLGVSGSEVVQGQLGISGTTSIYGATIAAGGVLGGLSISNLSTPAAPTVTTIGTTGSTTWGYKIVAVSASGGETAESAQGSTTSANGNATLTSSNYQLVTWTAIPGAVNYKIYRTAAGTSPSTIGYILTTTATSWDDTGVALGTDSNPAGTADSSGQIATSAGGIIQIGSLNSSTNNTINIGDYGSTTNTDNINIGVTAGANNSAIYIGGTGNSTGAITIGQSTGSQNISLGSVSTSGATTNVLIGAGTSNTAGSTTITGKTAVSITSYGTGLLSTSGSGALTITSAAAATWSTSSGQLTLQSGSGTLGLGSTTIVTNTGASLTLESATNDNFSASATGTGISNFGTLNTGNDVLGNNSGSVILLANTYTTSSRGVCIVNSGTGCGTTSSSPVLLDLDQDTQASGLATNENSTYCSSTINAGGIYYSAATSSFNTTTQELRGCIDGTWTDIVSADQLGIILYGVVPNSGTNAGDIGGITGVANGPCKVSWLSTTSINVAPCVAWSDGRKVVLTATTSVTGLSGASDYYHICLDGGNNGPSATTGNTSETAGLPTFSATGPILCLATVLTGSGGTITNIWDTRTFVGDDYEFVTTTAAMAPGWIAVQTAANQVTTTTTANAANVIGVIAAGSSAGSTTTINGIIDIHGPAYVSATTGTSATFTAGNTAQTTATAGYATQAAAAAGYKDLGQVVNPPVNTACTASTNCQFSMLVNVEPH